MSNRDSVALQRNLAIKRKFLNVYVGSRRNTQRFKTIKPDFLIRPLETPGFKRRQLAIEDRTTEDSKLRAINLNLSDRDVNTCRVLMNQFKFTTIQILRT